MLKVANIDLEAPDIFQIVRIFKDFAQLPIDESYMDAELGEISIKDSFLFETGMYDFTYSYQETYQICFVRQFHFSSVDGIAWFEQLHCIFFYLPEPDLRNLTMTFWSSESDNLADFFAWVEQTDSFLIPTQKYKPMRLEIYQEGV